MTRDPLRAVTLGLCLYPLSGPAWAEAEWPRADEATDYLAPALMAEAHPHWAPDRRDEGAAWGGFLVWPAVTLGAAFDSNPFQRHRAARPVAGVQIAPRFVAERDSGVHSTIAYADADARLYPETQADRLTGRVGVLHDWAPQRDLILRLQGEANRRDDPFDNGRVTGVGRDGLIEQTDLIASASVQKTASRFFAVLSGTALRSAFDENGSTATHAAGPRLSDENVLTLKGRAGYHIAPDLYAFAEPAANWRVLDAGSQRSDGTRLVAGIGADHLGLLDGELYAGWQRQDYAQRVSHLSSGVVGGRLGWSPHPAWTIAAGADESLGDVAVGTAADPVGTPTEQKTATVSARFTPSRLWSAEALLGASLVDYAGTPRHDRLVFGGIRGDYAVSRSIDLTASVQVAALQSSLAPARYRRATATLGATYHY